MTYIKRLVMKGFKSFARETTVLLDRHMNVIVGPNGSGKSNVTDALCFVLGRLSAKSIRAAKASHLIFSGNKNFKASNFAYVELVLDNENKTFSLDQKEIIIRRFIKKNGQSTYKINNETKTRHEVLELLSQAGIDPHGFNIVLQGEIQRFVKMTAEDRRKVIEEVAGISVYEMRKAKSLNELEKTEEKLKQISAILRERTNYLKNLENEREQALKFKKLEETVKRCKASIISRKLRENEKESKENNDHIDKKRKEIEKKSTDIEKLIEKMRVLNGEIENISKTIQKSSGYEQDALLMEISQLKQEIAGIIVRRENYENQISELNRREESLNNTIESSEREIKEMTEEKGKNTKQSLSEKKKKLDELDELKRQYYLLKSDSSSLSSQIKDKIKSIERLKNETSFILNQIESLEKEVKINESTEHHKKAISNLIKEIEENKEKLSKYESELFEKKKLEVIENKVIEDAKKIKNEVSKLDICPLCKTKMTEEHLSEVVNKSDKEIENSERLIKIYIEEIEKLKDNIEKTRSDLSKETEEINIRNRDILKLEAIADKKDQLKRNSEQVRFIESEHNEAENKKKKIDEKLMKTKITDEDYEKLQLEVNELQRSEERNLGIEITTKQRELERTRLAIKQISRDKTDITEELEELKKSLEEKQEVVSVKEDDAEILKKKYQKMFENRNSLQDELRSIESVVLKQQSEKRFTENEVNNLMIIQAQINARRDTNTQELEEFKNIEFIELPVDKLLEKLRHSEALILSIGSVNMRALEVYDDIKAEYDKIREKLELLEKEKLEILTIIEQIDKKKKKTFMKTLNEINELFSRNFTQLSTKGIVTLEPQDEKDPFNGGITITVKVSVGKYFDVTSLSGGEQTIVALSLIFAIQEHRPYSFYIFDEIDAALDRRNSEKLAYLLKKHMKQGQYLIITHNDSIISESSNILYGVSMQEGISKIISIEI